MQVARLTIQAAAIPVLALRAAVLLIALPLLQGINQMFTAVYQALDPINPANKNRLIASYTEEECWYLFRLKKDQWTDLFGRLNLPQIIQTPNGLICPGKHALLVYLYHLTCPTILLRMQNEFGRESSELSRIEKEIKSFLITNYRRFVVGNLLWYPDLRRCYYTWILTFRHLRIFFASLLKSRRIPSSTVSRNCHSA